MLGGRIVTEYDSAGARQTSYAYAGAEPLAVQDNADTATPSLSWRHTNPVTGDGRETDPSGRVTAETHMDTEGVDYGNGDPFAGAAGEVGGSGEGMSQSQINATVASLMPGWGGKQCKLSGFLMGCGQVARLVESGLAAPDNQPNVVAIYSRSEGRYVGLARWDPVAAANGVAFLGNNSTGYLPFGVTYKQGVGFFGDNLAYWFREGSWARNYPEATFLDEGSFRELYGFAPQQTRQQFSPLDPDQQKVVQRAINDAKDLAKKKECDQALIKYGIPSLAALINQLTTNDTYYGPTSTYQFNDNGVLKTAAQFASEHKESVGAWVNTGVVGNPLFLNYRFFSPASINWMSQQRAIMLLHEVVHKFGNKGDAAFHGSKQLSEKIIQGCYPALKGKLGGVG